MANKIIFMLTLILLYFRTGNILCKEEKIKYFLTNLDTDNLVGKEPSFINTKYVGIDNAAKSFSFKAFGKEYTVDLHIYYPLYDTEISHVSKLKNTSGTFLSSDYALYQGTVRDIKGSFVLGSFSTLSAFRGYILLSKSVYCIEPYDVSRQRKGSVIIYKFTDVIYPGCSVQGSNYDCSDTFFYKPWKPEAPPPKPGKSTYSIFLDTDADYFARYLNKLKSEALVKQGKIKNNTRLINPRQTRTGASIRRNRDVHNNDILSAVDGQSTMKNHLDDSLQKRGQNEGSKDNWPFSKHASLNERNIERKERQTGEKYEIEPAFHRNLLFNHHEFNNGSNFEIDLLNDKKNQLNGNFVHDDFEKYQAEAEYINQAKESSKRVENDRQSSKVADFKNELKTEEKSTGKGNESEKGQTIYQSYHLNNGEFAKKNIYDSSNEKVSDSKNNINELLKFEEEFNKVFKRSILSNELANEMRNIKSPLSANMNETKISNEISSTNSSSKNEALDSNGTVGLFFGGEIYESNVLTPISVGNITLESVLVNDKSSEIDKNISILNKESLDHRYVIKSFWTNDTHKSNKNDTINNNNSTLEYELLKLAKNIETQNSLLNKTHEGKTNDSKGISSNISEDELSMVMKNIKAFHSNIMNNNKEIEETILRSKENERVEGTSNPDMKTYPDPVVEEVSEKITSRECSVDVVIDPTLREKFYSRTDAVVKDVFIQITLLNKIFKKLQLEIKKSPFHLQFRVAKVTIYGDDVFNPITKDGNLAMFSKVHRQDRKYCLSIAFVNQPLKSGQYFQGYMPQGGGGVCSRGGNTIMISHGTADTPAPMAIYFASLLRGVTRALGATDTHDDCKAGSLPNPMTLIQSYILLKQILYARAYGVFTACNLVDMDKAMRYKDCPPIITAHTCGDAIVDDDERCDCGPKYLCEKIDPCCTPPLSRNLKPEELKKAVKGCNLRPKLACASHDGCCAGCTIMREKEMCYSGTGVCDIGTCDGKSSKCPTGTTSSDGMVCSAYNRTQPDPFICKGGKCEVRLCEYAGYYSCTCSPATSRECLYCCLKSGKCVSADELKLHEGRTYHLPDGEGCVGGRCLKGDCVLDYEHQKMPRAAVATSHGNRNWEKEHSLFIAGLLIFFVLVI